MAKNGTDKIVAKFKKEPVYWILLALAVYVIYVGYAVSDSQSVLLSCENNEPVALEYMENWLGFANATPTTMDELTIQNNLTYTGTWKVWDAPFGQLFTTSIDAITCSQALNYIAEEDNTSTFTTLEDRRVMTLNGQYYWCSHYDNIILKASDISVFSGYVSAFQECEEITVPDYWNLNTNTGQCEPKYDGDAACPTEVGAWCNSYSSEKACEEFESGKWYENQNSVCTPLNKDVNKWPADFNDASTIYSDSDCTKVIKKQCVPGTKGWVECYQTTCKLDGTWTTVPGTPCPECDGTWVEGECVKPKAGLLEGQNMIYALIIGGAAAFLLLKKKKKKRGK